MPFDVAAAKRHNSKLTDAEARTWARIANERLRACISGGGTDQSCSPSAIRIANAAINRARSAMTLDLSRRGFLKQAAAAGAVGSTRLPYILVAERNVAVDGAPAELAAKIPPVPKGATRFYKEMIREGKWTHPAMGWTLDVTPKRLEEWVATFFRMRADGVDITAPLDHSPSSKDNTGHWAFVWTDFDDRGRARLMGALDVEGPHAEMIGTSVKSVSVMIDDDVTAGNGVNYGEAIVHCSPCTQPVVVGQDSFARAAAMNGTALAAVMHEESDMDKLKKLAEGLGIEVGGDDTEDTLSQKIAEHGTKQASAIAQLTEEVAGLKKASAVNTEPKAGEPQTAAATEPAELPPEVKAQIEAALNAGRTGYARGVRADIERMVSEGRTTPAIVKATLPDIAAAKMSLSAGGVDPDIEAKLSVMRSTPPNTFPGVATMSTGQPAPDQGDGAVEDKDLPYHKMAEDANAGMPKGVL